MFCTYFFPMCPRMVGYFEEQVRISYTEYLKEIDEGRTENIKASNCY